MEYRQLGRSGFNVPVLTLGTGTFAGKGRLSAWGATDVAEASRLIDICLEHGLTMFDSADIYSNGASEEVLGKAINHLLPAPQATWLGTCSVFIHRASPVCLV